MPSCYSILILLILILLILSSSMSIQTCAAKHAASTIISTDTMNVHSSHEI